jgi:hypothetical protein
MGRKDGGMWRRLGKASGVGYLGALLGASAACVGQIGDRPGGGDGSGPGAVPFDPEAKLAVASGLRRLTVDEYDSTLRDLIGDDTRPSALLLPVDKVNPFDNDASMQQPSAALVEAAEALARDASWRLLAEPERRDEVIGCVPSGPDDEACLRSFIAGFGRRALRRTLEAEEIEEIAGVRALAVAEGDFYAAADAVLRTFLQHPEMLYRVETGAPVAEEPGLFRLSGNQVATRLSYLIWGSTPDDWMLDLAEDGQLETPEQVRAAAVQALDDPRARSRVARFHALWLGYETLPHPPELAQAMRAESDALVERVVFDERLPWLDVFRLEATFVGDALAEHYGLEPHGSDAPAWTSYAQSGRRGILSHGSFLANGAKFADTSPTQRGLAVRTRLLCQTIADPPPGVVTDQPPVLTEEVPCKKDFYQEVHAQGGCASCHSLMDPIGFGLEGYDQMGRHRAFEPDAPACAIDEQGEVAGVGAFQGPAGLAELLTGSEELGRCVVTQLYRFAMGRADLDEMDRALVEAVAGEGGVGEARFDEILLDLVAHPAFHHRREASEEP